MFSFNPYFKKCGAENGIFIPISARTLQKERYFDLELMSISSFKAKCYEREISNKRILNFPELPSSAAGTSGKKFKRYVKNTSSATKKSTTGCFIVGQNGCWYLQQTGDSQFMVLHPKDVVQLQTGNPMRPVAPYIQSTVHGSEVATFCRRILLAKTPLLPERKCPAQSTISILSQTTFMPESYEEINNIPVKNIVKDCATQTAPVKPRRQKNTSQQGPRPNMATTAPVNARESSTQTPPPKPPRRKILKQQLQTTQSRTQKAFSRDLLNSQCDDLHQQNDPDQCDDEIKQHAVQLSQEAITLGMVEVANSLEENSTDNEDSVLELESKNVANFPGEQIAIPPKQILLVQQASTTKVLLKDNILAAATTDRKPDLDNNIEKQTNVVLATMNPSHLEQSKNVLDESKTVLMMSNKEKRQSYQGDKTLSKIRLVYREPDIIEEKDAENGRKENQFPSPNKTPDKNTKLMKRKKKRRGCIGCCVQ